jgi:hypothetical protein
MHTARPGIFILLFFILSFTCPDFSFAQGNCNCDKFGPAQFDSLIKTNDSAGIYQTMGKLKQGSNNNCLETAYNLEITYLITAKKLKETLVLLQKQEQVAASAPCVGHKIQFYLNYADYNRVNQDYEGLSRYAFKALENAEQQNDKKYELKAIALIVHLFTRQNQEDKNWDYVKRAEKIILNLPEDYTTGINYNWLAFEYERKFTLAERLTLMDTAIRYAAKAKDISTRLNDYAEVTRSFRVFESNAYNRGELKKAIVYIDSAILYSKKIKIPANPSALYFAKAWDYLDLKAYAEAERWQDSSVYYALKYEGNTPATVSILGEAAKLYESAGNLPKAYATFKNYEHIKDSVFKVQRAEKINELELRYNKTTNERTIKELAQQKRILLLLTLAGVLGLLALAFFIRQQSLKNKQKILETEQRLNRARMNPHFFFNALSSLQSFALQENDGKALASNLSKFSHIMRETLESSYKDYVTVEQEIDFLNEYLELQKMRFPQKFTYEIITSPNIETHALLIPSMILQPFTENSIEHGFTGIDYAGHIKLSFDIKERDLLICITDNGKGLATTPKENSEHISRASQIIKDRFFLLNIKLKTRAGFSIDNNPEGKGVQVRIMLPVLSGSDIKNNISD